MKLINENVYKKISFPLTVDPDTNFVPVLSKLSDDIVERCPLKKIKKIYRLL